MKTIFSKYKDDINDILTRNIDVEDAFKNVQMQQKSFSESNNVDLVKGVLMEDEGVETKTLMQYDSQLVNQLFGKNRDSFETINIGSHPDFTYLQFGEYEKHHCVSVFVDIKGSTKLISKYSLLEVRLIKDTLLNLVIQISHQFGGHIHRLQGDAAFIQFVRRGKDANDALINALNSMSLLSFFVSEDLAEIMRNQNQLPLKIRVGIDYGRDEDVLWSHYGVPGCTELTTTSLHTDMAAKLQHKAYDNAIIIGDNVKSLLDLREDFWSYYQKKDSREYVYQISTTLSYKFYVFQWHNYLESFPFFKKNSNGRVIYSPKDFSLNCYVNDSSALYFPNSYSLDKGAKLKFELFYDSKLYHPKPNDKIEWIVHNFGKESDVEPKNIFPMDNFRNKNYCHQEARYLGNHFMRCKLSRQYLIPINIDFPIYVK